MIPAPLLLLTNCELDQCYSVAGNGCDRSRGVACRVPEEIQRNWGFWAFLASNLLWIIWDLNDHAYALIVLQFCVAALNIRGAMKTQTY